MPPVTPATWPNALAFAASRLSLDPDSVATWRNALVKVWLLIHRAPAPVRETYGTLPEDAIQSEAEAIYNAGDDAPAALSVDDCETDGQRLLRVAGWLRATERRVSETDGGVPPGNPNEDWRELVDDEPFFLVPMPRAAWRSPQDPRPTSRSFAKRALLRFRILPGLVGGVPIRLTDGRSLGPERTGLVFGASLFADFDILAEDEDDQERFLARTTVGPTRELVRQDVIAAATKGCAAHVFPELSLIPEVRIIIPETLAQAPWRDGSDLAPGPDLVVAGSWHERQGECVWNEARVYDAVGRELLRFRKLFRYRDKRDRYEKIEAGAMLEVLVTRMGLFGFGICLDMCQRSSPVLTDLDVDWLIVPSCGDWVTMSEHLDAARTSQVRYGTRCFIVQQIYPKCADGCLGYILPAPVSVGTLTEPEMRISQSFTSFEVVASTKR